MLHLPVSWSLLSSVPNTSWTTLFPSKSRTTTLLILRLARQHDSVLQQLIFTPHPAQTLAKSVGATWTLPLKQPAVFLHILCPPPATSGWHRCLTLALGVQPWNYISFSSPRCHLQKWHRSYLFPQIQWEPHSISHIQHPFLFILFALAAWQCIHTP